MLQHLEEQVLRAIDENPAFRDALRQRLLTAELINLPQVVAQWIEATSRRLEAVEGRLTRVEERLEAVETVQRQLVSDVAELKAELRADRSVNRGFHAIQALDRSIFSIAIEQGCLPVRTLTEEELYRMFRDDPTVSRAVKDSFRRADLVFEAVTEADGATRYFAVEASYTGEPYDVSRAARNSRMLAAATGCTTFAVVASLELTPEAEAELAAANCLHHRIAARHLQPR